MKTELNYKEFLEKLLSCANEEEISELVEDIHPADILDILHQNEDDFLKSMNY